MKSLITILLVLLIFGCSPSDNVTELQIEFDDMSTFDYDRISDMIRIENTKLNNVTAKTGGNSKIISENRNGVYFVPIYSNDIRPHVSWFMVWPVPDTSFMMWATLPKDGEDRAIVFSENEMMVNLTTQGPPVALRDLANGNRIKYANWCEENKTGLLKVRGKTTYNAIDQDNDGTIDLYHWGPNAQGTVLDKNFIMHVKSALTNKCTDPTEMVDLNLILQVQNGRLRETATIK